MVGKAQKAQPWLPPTMITLIIGIIVSSVIPRALQSFYMYLPFSSAHSPVRWGPSFVSIRELSLSTVTKPASRKARLGHHSVQSPHFYPLQIFAGLPWWLSGKESTCQCRRHRFGPWSGRSPGIGNGNPVQYSCLENPKDRGTWQAVTYGVTKSQTWLSMIVIHIFI